MLGYQLTQKLTLLVNGPTMYIKLIWTKGQTYISVGSAVFIKGKIKSTRKTSDPSHKEKEKLDK